MATDKDFIPRFAVRDAHDAEILADICEREAARHIKIHNEPGHSPDHDHLTMGNVLMVMAIDLREAAEFSKRFAKTLEEIQGL